MATRLIRGLYNITVKDQGSVLTIGNFDGVHRGHAKLLLKTRELAKKWHTSSMLMTFEPHPTEFFSSFKPVPRLTSWREKFTLLKGFGIDRILMVPFNTEFANLTAEAFIQQILCETLHVKAVVIGDDFQFGQGRKGTVTLLQELGARLGFYVEPVSAVTTANHQRISSTRIRQALAEANLPLAAELLGWRYQIAGRVVHGDKLGRTMGFPTANIQLHRQVAPLQGVYSVRMHGLGDHALPGVANLGTRPTIGGTKARLEVHLFDFNDTIYGRHVSVEFCQKIRDEERFSDVALLIAKMEEDAQYARDYFEMRGEM